MKTVQPTLFGTIRLYTRCESVRSCNRFLKWTTVCASRCIVVVTLWDGKDMSSQYPRKCRITPRENQQARHVPPDCGPCDDQVEDWLKSPGLAPIRSTCKLLPVGLTSELAVRSSLLILRTPQEDGFQLQGVRDVVGSSSSLLCTSPEREIEHCTKHRLLVPHFTTELAICLWA